MRARTSPTISVVIPTYQRRAHLLAAVASVQRQTVPASEIIVVDDGSSDGTAEALHNVGDPRLRLIRHDHNRGVSAARNMGLDAARGEFIAWLDSDDVARPRRLERQVRALQRRPEVAMASCCAGKISGAGRRRPGLRAPPLSAGDVSAWLLFRPAFQQSGVFGRAEVLRRYPYRPDLEVCEDFDVFLRMRKRELMINIPEVLIDRRLHAGQTIRTHRSLIQQRKAELLLPILHELGLAPTHEDLMRHVRLGQTDYGDHPPEPGFLELAEDWLLRVRQANAQTGYTSPHSMRIATSYFWGLACRAASRNEGMSRALRTFSRSPLADALFSAQVLAWAAEVAPMVASSAFG
jgi:glycosyltransferase involved in cell wall biosynthesis